jgi:hypothetical protein
LTVAPAILKSGLLGAIVNPLSPLFRLKPKGKSIALLFEGRGVKNST